MNRIKNGGVDISYIWTAESWLYLAIIVDFYSRRIIGWEARDRMKKDLAPCIPDQK